MTSIEYLIEQLEGSFSIIARAVGVKKYNEIVRNAVEIHKQEIIKANRDGVDMAVDKKPFIMGEQYYQEMFELEQELDIPSHMRWHNREEPKQETTLEEAAESLFPDSSIQKRIFIKGAKWQEEHSKSLSDKWKEYQDWLNELPEISDEEIEKAARDYDNSVIYGPPLLHFEQGAFWYREQLKSKSTS